MAGLPPTSRLRRAADFAALRHAHGRLQAQHFSFRWMPAAGGVSRLGMAVSRKVSKRAVERNRIKRTIRESFRAAREGMPAVDVLVIARSSAAACPKHGLRDDLGRAWSRLGTLKQTATPGTIGG